MDTFILYDSREKTMTLGDKTIVMDCGNTTTDMAVLFAQIEVGILTANEAYSIFVHSEMNKILNVA